MQTTEVEMATTTHSLYRDQALQALDNIPQEYLPVLVKMIRAFGESFVLPSAEESFRQGLREAQSGETRPIHELWDGIDAE
jgi:hypothetical protein